MDPRLSDTELMQRIIQRDQRALSELYRRYGNPVYSMALRVLSIPVEAEEVTQDTFLKVWNQAERWDSNRGKLSSWLLAITRNAAIDRLRKENRQPTVTAIPVDEMPHLTAERAVVDDPNWQNGQMLRSLLGQLPEEQAQVIQLAFFQGLTHSQMARMLDLPLGTVKTRVRLGLQKMKTMWQEAGTGGTG
jgi:RNA polymerase sigma-70 factor (ECF subfamily)